MAYSFAPRLRLAPLWPALAALALAATLASILLPRTLAEAATAQLSQETRLLMAAVPAPAEFTGPDLALEARLRQLVAGTDFRITVVALDGTVLADSDRRDDELAAMDNHRSRPEIALALARGEGSAVRHSDTTGHDTLYAARLVRDGAGRSWILRLGQPLSTISALKRHLSGILLLAVLAALVLVALVSWWLTRALFRPLGELLAAADLMGRGDYTAPFRIPDQRELARLGNSLARIARHAGEQLAAVEAERDHLRATVAGMTEGVLVTDARGRVRLFNPAFCEIFGVAANVPPSDVLDLAREPGLVDLIRLVLADGSERSLHLERMEPVRRTLALAGSKLSAQQGAVVVVRDITEAEQLHRMRRDFVANVSHELRTPLAAIQGYAETLCDGAIDERDTALRFSQRIVDQCRRLAALLADLLTLSRLEGKEPLETLEPVDLRTLAREALELVAGQAAAKQVAVELTPGPSPIVPGDPEGLFRLLSNLLENAVKYNRPGGRVEIRLQAPDDPPAPSSTPASTAAAATTAMVMIEVRDTGIGIPASALPRIFERFYRVDKGRAREEGGTGLGLAIVKHVAQAHQGRVEVESELGAGSTFRVLLPAPRS